MKLIIPLVAAALFLTGCSTEVPDSSSETASPSAEYIPGFDSSAYNYLQTACDRFGNQIYLFDGYHKGGLVVLPNAKACPQPENRVHPAIARLTTPSPDRHA